MGILCTSVLVCATDVKIRYSQIKRSSITLLVTGLIVSKMPGDYSHLIVGSLDVLIVCLLAEEYHLIAAI